MCWTILLHVLPPYVRRLPVDSLPPDVRRLSASLGTFITWFVLTLNRRSHGGSGMGG